jgi:prophage antirepressor-like protein
MKGKDRISRAHSQRFGPLDILMINGRLHFPATECAVVPGCKDPHKAVRDHCKGVNESFSPTARGTMRKAGHQPIRKGAAWSA